MSHHFLLHVNYILEEALFLDTNQFKRKVHLYTKLNIKIYVNF